MGSEGMGFSKTRSLGIVDVGIIVLSHCENPVKNDVLDFIEKIFLGEINAVIPLSTFIGAYHIMTKYLRIKREVVKEELLKTLEIRSPFFIQDILIDHVIAGIKYASKYNIEGWDGYLISLADSLGASIIYTIDKKLRRVKHISIVIPISRENLKKYNLWVKKRLSR
ncbi:MAG: hypothetical protein DRJ45_06340 [Thermoprotei archaeon]|nr:MAG: hypothetical protein DRJ45_06340 [Thermoprotei archaeon]